MFGDEATDRVVGHHVAGPARTHRRGAVLGGWLIGTIWAILVVEEAILSLTKCPVRKSGGGGSFFVDSVLPPSSRCPTPKSRFSITAAMTVPSETAIPRGGYTCRPCQSLHPIEIGVDFHRCGRVGFPTGSVCYRQASIIAFRWEDDHRDPTPGGITVCYGTGNTGLSDFSISLGGYWEDRIPTCPARFSPLPPRKDRHA